MTDLVRLGFRAETTGILKAQRDMDGLTAAGGRLDKQNRLAEKSLGLVGAAIAALGIVASTRDLINYADTWMNVNSQLRQVTTSEQGLLDVRKQLIAVTKDTRMELTNTVNLYAEMQRGTSELNISSDRLIGVTKTLNNLFLAGGKPISEAAGAIRQLNQGFASGVLRGDEFNSVAEGAPKVLDALTAKLKMTRGELREFAATGGITAKIMIEAIEDYRDSAQRLADQTAKTFGQNLQNAQTNVTEFVGNSQALNSAVGGLGQGIEDLSENLDALVDAGSALVTVVGIGLTPVMYKYVTSLAATTQAQLLAGTSAIRTANAFGVVTTTAASATVATNALGIATRFLMGPWGLLILGLGAAYTAFELTSSSMDETTKKANEQADAVSRLEKLYAAMTEKQLGTSAIEAQQRAIEIDKERLEIQEKLANYMAPTRSGSLIDTGELKLIQDYGQSASELKSRLSELDLESKKLNETIDVINSVFDKNLNSKNENSESTGKLVSENKKAAKSYADMIKNLELERIQLTMTTDEFEIYMVMQQASANQWTPEMTQQIINQTKALQDQRNAIELTNIQLDNMMSGELFGFGDKADEESAKVGSLADSIDNLGGAWSRTGSIVVDTFGTISDALNDYSAKMTEIGKLQSSLDDERQKSGADNAKLDRLQMKLNDERTSAEISNYRNIAGAAESMFSEKTAAAKAFGAINKVLAIAEIAMSYQKIAAGTAATTAHVAQEGTKQGANALTAITGAFAAPLPVNFAMGAAMIGIMAGLLGGSFGGGGASYAMPEEGGTGTVLGDSSAQSESISNAMDNYDDIQIDQLAELRGIRTALSGLSGGIERLASQFSTSLDFGDSGVKLENSNFLDTGLGTALRKIDPVARVADWIDSITGDLLGLGGIADKIFGGFSSKKQKLIDSGISFVSQTMEDVFDSGQLDADMYQVIETTKKKFWGLSKKTSTNTDTTSISGAINKQMADIFTFVGDSVISATESLGLEASHIIHTGIGSLGLEDALNGFVIDIGSVSFKDKTGEEIQKELEAIFSQQADLMAEYLVPSINEYQKVGEGAFETLQRVAYEQTIFNDSLERTGMNLSELSKLMQIDVAQSIIGIIGSVEKFSELSNDFFESFYSEAEQLAYLEKSLTDVFSSLGLGLVSNRDEFRALVEGVDLTTAAGQELYATLLQISPAMSEYLDALEDEQEERKKLRIKFLEDEKSLISATVNDLARLTSSITSELGIAYSIQESLAAARKGDFDLAMRMTNQRVNASGFGNSVDFARAKAIEDNNLYEIAMLAGEQKTELERQIDILNNQIDAIENGTAEQVNAIIDLGATITETGEMIVNRMAGGINSIPEARYSGQELQSNQPKMDIEKQKNEAKKSAEMQERMNLEIIKNTKTTAKILQKIELNGVRVLQ